MNLTDYNVTFCDANGLRSDRPNGGLYINETDKSSTITAKSSGYETAIVSNTGAPESLLCVSTGQANAEMLKELCPALNCIHKQPYIVDCRNLTECMKVSGTLQAKSGGGYSLNFQNPVRVGYRVRRLTPLECERLQGFPDGWTEGLSDSARYRALGNSLAIPCAEYVLKGIAWILNERN